LLFAVGSRYYVLSRLSHGIIVGFWSRNVLYFAYTKMQDFFAFDFREDEKISALFIFWLQIHALGIT
jgi:hypothetical protein